MGSGLDNAMNRGTAMVVKLPTANMLERATQLEEQHPGLCWVSDISSVKDVSGQHIRNKTFYYFLENGKYWVNENWIQTGVGSQRNEND